MAKKNFVYDRLSRRIASEERSKAQREAERMRQEFTANVSHELKTPLQSISGYAELLKGGMVKEEDVQQFAERIYSESQRMITLVNDILELFVKKREWDVRLPRFTLIRKACVM